MSKTALVVDDSKTIRHMVSTTLRDAGFDVLEGGDGSEGLTWLDGRRVELIVTDVNMPVLDGIEMIRRVRERDAYRYTPILVLTTESKEARKQEGKQAGATGWIVKPFHPRQLIQVVDRVVPA